MLITLEGAFDNLTKIAAKEIAIIEMSNKIVVFFVIGKTSFLLNLIVRILVFLKRVKTSFFLS